MTTVWAVHSRTGEVEAFFDARVDAEEYARELKEEFGEAFTVREWRPKERTPSE